VSMDKSGKLVSLFSTYGGDSTVAPAGLWQGGGGCGIWMAGTALASDNAGRLYFSTGNAAGAMFTANDNVPSSGRTQMDTLSQSIVRLGISSEGVLTLQDYFQPTDYRALDGSDRDLGSGGVALWNLVSPAGGISSLAINCGKNGYCYVANADNLGGYRMGQSRSDALIQMIQPQGYVTLSTVEANFLGVEQFSTMLESIQTKADTFTLLQLDLQPLCIHLDEMKLVVLHLALQVRLMIRALAES
jgi:hypothetical protein